MIQVKHVTASYRNDYEGFINDTIREYTTKSGWKLIDIKHTIILNGNDKICYSALLLFDDSPTADIPTSLNQL